MVGSGTTDACTVAGARFVPKMEIRLPGEMFGWNDAPLLTPPTVGCVSPATEHNIKPKHIRENMAALVYRKYS
jgi:hypothetical protein